MAESAYKINCKTVNDIWNRLSNSYRDFQEILFQPELEHSFPSTESLSNLIDVSFWASLQKEEGRPVRFSIAYQDPERLDKAFVLESSQEFNIERVVSLAPSLEETDRYLGVWPDKGRLRVWGWCYPDRPILFWLNALGPGQIEIATWNTRALIDGSRTEFITSINQLALSLRKKISPNDPEDSTDLHFVTNFEAVLSIAQTMRSLGHGGTLLVLPQGSGDWRKRIDHAYFPRSPFQQANEDLQKLKLGIAKGNLTGNKLISAFSEPNQILQQSLLRSVEHIARLTAVDGAMILTWDLSVLAFGAKIRSLRRPKSYFQREPFEGSKWGKTAQAGGTRHQSAASFVWNQKDSVAFIISQDGNVTMLFYDDKIGSTPREKTSMKAVRHVEFTFRRAKEIWGSW
jgi:hypothetical protein